jgi:hypothetical protein
MPIKALAGAASTLDASLEIMDGVLLLFTQFAPLNPPSIVTLLTSCSGALML